MTPEDAMPEVGMGGDESPVMPEAESEVPRQSRRFRAWGAAQKEESGPSLWSRASGAIKRLFTKPQPAEPEIVAEESAADALSIPVVEAPADDPFMPSSEPQVEELAPMAEEELAPVEMSPDEAKEDLKFLRTGEADAVTEEDALAAMHEGPTSEMEPVAPVEDSSAEPPKKRRASLLK